jgi:hypothetical protein
MAGLLQFREIAFEYQCNHLFFQHRIALGQVDRKVTPGK